MVVTELQSRKMNKWYTKNWVIIVFLIFLFPVGLFLMWKYAKWFKVIKIIITIIFGLGVIGTLSYGE